MKKVPTIMLMLWAGMTISAQEVMIKHRSKGDPLMGTKPYTYWESKHVYIWESDEGNVGMCIQNPSHVFTSELLTRIGFYSAKGELILATDGWGGSMETGSLSMFLKYGHTKDTTSVYSRKPDKETEVGKYAVWELTHENLVEKEHLLKFLKETDGYIRIVTPIYYGGYFDVKAKLQK